MNISDLEAFQNIEVLPNNYGDGLCFGSYRLYLNGTEVTSVSVPNNITSVGLIYSGCASLKSLACGDANGNDVIDPNDIELVRDFIMTGEEPDGFKWQNANANGDSEINAVDIVEIVKISESK